MIIKSTELIDCEARASSDERCTRWSTIFKTTDVQRAFFLAADGRR
jgi:hypothetical protein